MKIKLGGWLFHINLGHCHKLCSTDNLFRQDYTKILLQQIFKYDEYQYDDSMNEEVVCWNIPVFDLIVDQWIFNLWKRKEQRDLEKLMLTYQDGVSASIMMLAHLTRKNN